jgi:protein ImuB
MEVVCVLIPDSAALADPVEAGELTERLLRRLERIGAAVESERPREAFFVLDGLRGLYGGERTGVLAAARRAAKMKVRIGVAPTRFAAHAAAQRETIVPPTAAGDFLAALPVSTLAGRLVLSPREAGGLAETMRRLGIEALGELAAIPADRVADRFGAPGLEARRLARGEEEPLRPRHPHEELVEALELPEGAAGGQLEHALKLLVDRLLAAPQRRGRTLLGLRLGALLAGGGSWSVDQGLGRPTASARTLCALLTTRLETLPGPVAALRLRALGLGPPAGDQLELSVSGCEHRQRRLGEAIREVRATQGTDSLLQVLPLDSSSRFPERWAILTPSPDR